MVLTIENERRKRSRKNPTPQKAISKNTRYLRYHPMSQYQCIRQGIPLPPGQSPDTFRDHLTFDHLFIFEHVNGPLINRANKDTPRFIGVFQMADGSTLVHPQDQDFRRVYAQRANITQAWDILEDGLPYWCDAHAHRMCKRMSKK